MLHNIVFTLARIIILAFIPVMLGWAAADAFTGLSTLSSAMLALRGN